MKSFTKILMLAAFALTTMFMIADEPTQAASVTDNNSHHQLIDLIEAPPHREGPVMKLGGYPSGTETVHTEPGARILRDPWGRYWIEIDTAFGRLCCFGPYSSEQEARDALDKIKRGRFPGL